MFKIPLFLTHINTKVIWCFFSISLKLSQLKTNFIKFIIKKSNYKKLILLNEHNVYIENDN